MFGALRGGRLVSRVAARSVKPFSPAQPSCFSISSRYPLRISIQKFHSSMLRAQEAATEAVDTELEPANLTRFQELADHRLISPQVIDTLTKRMNIETMTDVQSLTINETLDGGDVIAQAKTGTGKTIAFLMPVIQRILQNKYLANRSSRSRDVDIRALIISPTRELAEQIAAEARKVVSATDIRVQTAVGGTGKSQALKRMSREGCHILVGTPGRVKDLLSDPRSGVSLENIETFVLDEADRLLDIGFAPDIDEIQSYMPSRSERQRQTLMFSATLPKQVVGLVRKTLRPDFKFIQTDDPNEAPTHTRIPQKAVFIRGHENKLPALLELCHRFIKAHEQDPENVRPFKAIVYLPATAEVTLAQEIFSNMYGSLDESKSSISSHPLSPAHILEIHSKLTQAERTRNAARFRNAKSAILFSSDVTARGMDFPEVTHVIQMGLPRNEEDYVHRLGRTGRAGKSGEGWLLILEDQIREFKRGLGSQLPIQNDTSIETASIDMSSPSDVSEKARVILNKVHDGAKATPYPSKAQAYVALFGVMNQGRSVSKQRLVNEVNNLATYGWGMTDLPALRQDLVDKLGLGRVTGLKIKDESNRRDRGGFNSDRGSRNGSFNRNDPFGLDAERIVTPRRDGGRAQRRF